MAVPAYESSPLSPSENYGNAACGRHRRSPTFLASVTRPMQTLEAVRDCESFSCVTFRTVPENGNVKPASQFVSCRLSVRLLNSLTFAPCLCNFDTAHTALHMSILFVPVAGRGPLSEAEGQRAQDDP
jgi:hypothetical protein